MCGSGILALAKALVQSGWFGKRDVEYETATISLILGLSFNINNQG